jgi:hypothetical protein
MVFVASIVFSLVGAIGCGTAGTPKVQTVQAPAPDPTARVKALLTNYANGAPVTSEAASFDQLAAQVKEKDAAKGDIVEKGLQDIKAHPNGAKTKAAELLKKL